MKFFSLMSLSAVLLLAGCASSERMMRTSGGVLQEYSAPKPERIASGKFAKELDNQAKNRREQLQNLGNIHETLVNVWPFFFRNRAYLSILWPVIDYDPYGFAVRPFYNQEGDERSIFFPLSAWNSAQGNGWVLNAYWAPDTWGFFPLVHKGVNNGMITPLWFYSAAKPNSAPRFNNTLVSGSFHLFGLLGYCKFEERLYDPGKYHLETMRSIEQGNQDLLAYQLAPYGIKPPFPASEDKAGWDALKSKIAERFVSEKDFYGGFFPLFHVSRDHYEKSFRILGWFPSANWSAHFTQWGFFGWLLGGYESGRFSGNPHRGWTKEWQSFYSLVTLSGYSRKVYFKDTPQVRIFEEIAQMNPQTERKKIQELLSGISPSEKIPDTVTDKDTLHLFLRELAERTELETETYTDWGFLPLCLHFNNSFSQTEVFPALISWCHRKKNPDKTNFFSLPLLSWGSYSQEQDETAVLLGLAYRSREQRFNSGIAAVHDPDGKEPPNAGLLSQKETNLFLTILAKMTDKEYFVARPGYDFAVLEDLRKNVDRLAVIRKNLQDRRGSLAQRRANVGKQIPKNRREELKRLLELEDIKDGETALGQANNELVRQEGALVKKAADAHLPELPVQDPNAAKRAIHAVCDKIAYSGYRSLIFRRENYSTGRYRWDFLGIFSGEGDKDKDSIQFLQFLYRYKREGAKSETVYFPFVSIQQDGENSRFRFLWRVYEKTVENGRTSGHILFIPYGD